MSKFNGLTRDELSELLRYYIGDPIPYIQDGRYRDLYETFKATDDRPYTGDERMAPVAADDSAA